MKPEQCHLTNDLLTHDLQTGDLQMGELEEFQQEIDLLQRADFSRQNNARSRVQLRLEARMLAQPWWRCVLGNVSTVQMRLAVALSALLLFGGLNAQGLFSLPQHAAFVAPIPFATAVFMGEFGDTGHEYMGQENEVLGTFSPDLSLARTTPQVQTPFAISLPTPIPVPAPVMEDKGSIR